MAQLVGTLTTRQLDSHARCSRACLFPGYGGRNRKCAEAFAAAGKKKSLDEIEAELLGGQKLQGTLTAKEVNHILKMKGLEHEFPFFTTVYKISYEDTPLSAITETPY